LAVDGVDTSRSTDEEVIVLFNAGFLAAGRLVVMEAILTVTSLKDSGVYVWATRPEPVRGEERKSESVGGVGGTTTDSLKESVCVLL
jgi:hypothetical protein